jgi:demethylmenaquinone methyltransferase/2-methoxy-6-polyprenyl-1,4-benzoquinol methylase
MFDAIAPRYDFLNRMLSFRRDVKWRRALAKSVSGSRYRRVLDMATGTGDVLFALDAARNDEVFYVGGDMSGEMLTRARAKIAGRPDGGMRFSLSRCDAERMPFVSESFDAVTIAFGIRNVPNPVRGLEEMRRVLAPGGRLSVLEFSLPSFWPARFCYLFYFRRILPLLGGMVSGDFAAYHYLNRSAESFPHGKAFCDIMRDCGFEDVAARPLTFGVATLYTGEKSCVV